MNETEKQGKSTVTPRLGAKSEKIPRFLVQMLKVLVLENKLEQQNPMIFINCYWFAFKSSESSFLVIAINHISLNWVYLADIVLTTAGQIKSRHELLTGFHFGWFVGWQVGVFLILF